MSLRDTRKLISIGICVPQGRSASAPFSHGIHSVGLSGGFRGYSVERLLRFANALHHNVRITIEAEATEAEGQLVMA